MAPKTPTTLDSNANTLPREANSVSAHENWRAVLVSPETFDKLKAVQKAQLVSPRFDLGALADASLDLMLSVDNAASMIHQQAAKLYKQRP
jgi:hypothetical protein